MFYNNEEKHWDISYNLGKKFWGNGYTTEAMQQVMIFAKEEIKLNECITSCAVENPSSSKVLEKLGFKFEREAAYIYSNGEKKTIGRYYRWIAM